MIIDRVLMQAVPKRFGACVPGWAASMLKRLVQDFYLQLKSGLPVK